MTFFPLFQTSQQVAEYNVISMFHELATGTKYDPPKPDTTETDKPQSATLTGKVAQACTTSPVSSIRYSVVFVVLLLIRVVFGTCEVPRW